MTLPTFLLVGAQKAGTTWLARMLEQHPEVHMPATKELHHFDLRERFERGLDAYAAEFSGASGAVTAVGEATPNYLGVTGIPDAAHDVIHAAGVRIEEHPEVLADPAAAIRDALGGQLQLVVIVRDPVARAISAWRHHIRRGRMSPRASFREACGSNGILTMGFYHHHLTRWFSLFPREQFEIFVFEEDVIDAPEATISRSYRHLSVDPGFRATGTSERANERSSDLELHLRAIRPGAAERLARRFPVIRRVDWPRIAATDDDRRFLTDLYSDDTAALEELLGRSLAGWREAALR